LRKAMCSPRLCYEKASQSLTISDEYKSTVVVLPSLASERWERTASLFFFIQAASY
jgi:hypothetical protein